ncbi:alpha/beta fold hydrolase [Caenimonas koreensis]|uniref:alpha/beta fold hydrolase n=1 Tax=Caenimonas koreensis TaxID=367474 RepID=UPI002B2775CD|nr:alpha/beta fold hydrolase [Caenimonas koreensis]
MWRWPFIRQMRAMGGSHARILNLCIAQVQRNWSTRIAQSSRGPMLVMCGEDDLLAPPAKSREIASLVPHAQLVMVPQCGHMLTMEQPDFVNETLAAWLAGLPL